MEWEVHKHRSETCSRTYHLIPCIKQVSDHKVPNVVINGMRPNCVHHWSHESCAYTRWTCATVCEYSLLSLLLSHHGPLLFPLLLSILLNLLPSFCLAPYLLFLNPLCCCHGPLLFPTPPLRTSQLPSLPLILLGPLSLTPHPTWTFSCLTTLMKMTHTTAGEAVDTSLLSSHATSTHILSISIPSLTADHVQEYIESRAVFHKYAVNGH